MEQNQSFPSANNVSSQMSLFNSSLGLSQLNMQPTNRKRTISMESNKANKEPRVENDSDNHHTDFDNNSEDGISLGSHDTSIKKSDEKSEDDVSNTSKFDDRDVDDAGEKSFNDFDGKSHSINQPLAVKNTNNILEQIAADISAKRPPKETNSMDEPFDFQTNNNNLQSDFKKARETALEAIMVIESNKILLEIKEIEANQLPRINLAKGRVKSRFTKLQDAKNKLEEIENKCLTNPSPSLLRDHIEANKICESAQLAFNKEESLCTKFINDQEDELKKNEKWLMAKIWQDN